MVIIPAIDILGGKCVRLTQGNYLDVKVYNNNPVDVALEFQNANLDYLHLVDLDGAKKGSVVNWEIIRKIQEYTALKVDFGGGVKSDTEVEALLDLGINQINVGSIAVKEPAKFKRWIKTYGGENFILSADVRDDNVLIHGWLEGTSLTIYELIEQYAGTGLEYVNCTDISSDGMMMGPNFGLYKKLQKRYPHLKINASGGITSIDDLKQLEYIKVHGAIIGKSLYEKKVNLDDLRANF